MRKFEVVADKYRTSTGAVILPTRADKGSAGYDIYTPQDFCIEPKQSIFFNVDVKVQMGQDEVFLIFARSSVGIKRQVIITNGTGVIDSTYYGNATNDGNIGMALTNIGTETQCFKKGERIAQGVFVKYLVTDDDKPLSEERNGGIGSTGK